MREEDIFIPPDPSAQSSHVLSRKIPAIQLECRGALSSGTAKLGPILQLPAGTNVDVCGAGFDARTVKVRHHDAYYFVFREDLGIRGRDQS